MATRKEILEIGGREVAISNPDKVYFPRAGHTKLDLVRYFLAVADGALVGVRGRPMALKRFVDGAEKEPFFQKRAPDNRPDWMRVATLTFPSGRTADELVVDEAAGPRLGRQPGLPGPQPASRPRRGPGPPRRAAHRPRSRCRACRGRTCARSPWSAARRSRRWASSAGRRRPARAASTSTCASSRAGRTRRSGGRRWRWRGTSSGGRPSIATSQVVEGGAPRRLPGLQPEREGPDRRVRLLRATHAGRAGLVPAALGRGAGLRHGGLHAGDGPRAVRGARRRRGRDRRRRWLARGPAGAVEAPRGRGRGRRAVAAQLRQAGGRAAAGPAVPQAARRRRLRGPRCRRRSPARGRRGAGGRGGGG